MNQNKIGRVAVVAVSTCIGIGLGLLAGNALKQELLVIAVLFGWLTGTPIGIAIALNDRKWVAIALIFGLWILSYVNGQWLGLGLAVATSFSVLYTVAVAVKDVFGADSDPDALWKCLLLILGRTLGLQEIDNGKTVVPGKAGRLLGPQHIKIRPGNAIALARSHRPQNGNRLEVIGPGDFTSGVGDHVAAVFDLRTRQKTFTFESVQTTDAVRVSVQVEVRYSINVRRCVCEGDQEINDAEKECLRAMAVASFDWDTATRCAVESSVRSQIGKTQSERLLKGQRLDRFSRHIRQHAYRTLCRQGIALHSVIISDVQKV